jgi:hypothetical protein
LGKQMTGKPRFLKNTRDLFGPHALRLAKDVLYLNGKDAQSIGGLAKANKNAARDQKIRAEFEAAIKVPGAKHGAVVKKLADKNGLSDSRFRAIIRPK